MLRTSLRIAEDVGESGVAVLFLSSNAQDFIEESVEQTASSLSTIPEQ